MKKSSEMAVNSIVSLLLMYKESLDDSEYSFSKSGVKYLINQSLRQLWLPVNKRYISVKAYNLFKQITDDDPFKFYGKDKVTNKVSSDLKLSLYKGASSLPDKVSTVNKNTKFVFNDVFHDDHIIPIKRIIEKLIKIEFPNLESVYNVIKDISICRMLKSEDRSIKNKSNRPYDERDIITNLYKEKHSIIIKDYTYW